VPSRRESRFWDYHNLTKSYTYLVYFCNISGLGPTTYFWADTSTTPSDNGRRLYDSLGSDTPSCGLLPLVAADGNSTYRIEFPNGTSVYDYLGGCTFFVLFAVYTF
jgi:hypothetical protein